ncbi:MAG: helix-turn-helix domain-containing protein [Clostridia bacterium]|nr:helix-turn-helix domain-containing protein [Clostridia bacterium]
MTKTKYERWLQSFGLERVRRLAEEGLSDEEIAIASGIEISTFRLWKRMHPDFAEALGLGRENADYDIVRALYKKATGYNVAVDKTYKLKRVEFDPETGKKIREYEELATGVDTAHVPADLRAEIFWLKNRQPERWSDRLERETDGEGGGVIEMPEADSIDEEN